MLKKTIVMLLLFLIVISGLLLWQWKTYQGGADRNPENKMVQAVQHITIEAAEKELIITQTITGLLREKEYQIIRPDKLFRWLCIDEHGESCQSDAEEIDTYQTDNGALRFTFNIPFPEQSAYYLTDWTTKLTDIEIKETAIEVVDGVRRGGTWIAGIPEIGSEKLSLIDFYTFKGSGGTPALYWQRDPLERKDLNKTMSLYGNPLLVQVNDFPIFTSIERNEFLAVVYTDDIEPSAGQGIKIVSNASTAADIEHELLMDYYLLKFTQLSENERWILDFLTAITLDKAPVRSKSEVIMGELSQNLTEEEQKSFLLAVQSEKKLLDFERLDQLLGDVKGLKTTFFLANKAEENELIPLFFMDLRSVMVNNHDTNINIIYNKDEILFPFVETIEAIGFQVETKKNTFDVSSQKDIYTFYLDQPIFTRNGVDFGLLEDPLSIKSGQVFIKSQTLRTIFHVSITEDAQSIMLMK